MSSRPHQVVIAQTKTCPYCAASVAVSRQQMTGCYERIDLPLVEPQITRVERYGGTCPHCQQRYESPVPVSLGVGSPFGPHITSVVTHLRYRHAVSYQQLCQLMVELYGLTLSEGAIANLLHSTQASLAAPISRIQARLR